MKSTPASTAHATCSSNMARAAAADCVVPLDEDVRVADVAGEEGAVLEGDLLRERERLAVERLEQILLADHLQLLAVPVVGERLDDVGSRSHELDVELTHDVGVLEHDLGDEAARLEIARAARARTGSPRRR